MPKLRVLSYNTRYENDKDLNEKSIDFRKKLIVDSIEKVRPDLIGFQEVRDNLRKYLEESLPDYALVGCGRNEDCKGEATPIAYRKDRFTLLSVETFWLSREPHKPASLLGEGQSGCPRICTIACFFDKESGRSFRHYNTHLDHNKCDENARAFALAKAAGEPIVDNTIQSKEIDRLLPRFARDYSENPVPMILTGDFNATPLFRLHQALVDFRAVGAPLRNYAPETEYTFHNFLSDKADDYSFIDYIYSNLDRAGASFVMDEKEYGLVSDHYPIGTDLEL